MAGETEVIETNWHASDLPSDVSFMPMVPPVYNTSTYLFSVVCSESVESSAVGRAEPFGAEGFSIVIAMRFVISSRKEHRRLLLRNCAM